MKTYKIISIKTDQYIQFVDITSEINRYVSETDTINGIILVYTPHTTAGITINENADPAVTMDISSFLKKKIPHESYFNHMEGNSPSHIMSSLFSSSETLIINDGQLVLGTWQCIYFCEFDGPRSRKVYLKIIADHH
jgi:secondary thiamine-phosphate synthase enzyme